MDVNGVNLNANEIFAKLDSMDNGGNDGKIEASIWNQFADIAGGKHVNYAILKENAIKSISTYLSRATAEIKTKIAEFVNDVSKPSDVEEQARLSYIPSAENGWNMDKLNSYLDKYKKTAESNGVNNEYSIEDLDMAINRRNGSDVETTAEQRKTALSAKASNGMTYIEANLIMRNLLDKHVKNLTSTNLAAKIDYYHQNSKKENRWYVQSKAIEIMQKDYPDDYAKYNEAQKASAELTEKYPDILKCLVDARNELYNV